MKRWLILVVVFLFVESAGWAQCAMCRTQLENNYAQGNPGIAAGINTGILYLLTIPYLAAMVIWYLWYKASKNAKTKLSDRAMAR
jgi:hypothetical protein